MLRLRPSGLRRRKVYLRAGECEGGRFGEIFIDMQQRRRGFPLADEELRNRNLTRLAAHRAARLTKSTPAR